MVSNSVLPNSSCTPSRQAFAHLSLPKPPCRVQGQLSLRAHKLKSEALSLAHQRQGPAPPHIDTVLLGFLPPPLLGAGRSMGPVSAAPSFLLAFGFRAPQHAFLGPSLYTHALGDLIQSYGFGIISYSDDSPIFISFPSFSFEFQTRVPNRLPSISTWTSNRHFEFNVLKIEPSSKSLQ